MRRVGPAETAATGSVMKPRIARRGCVTRGAGSGLSRGLSAGGAEGTRVEVSAGLTSQMTNPAAAEAISQTKSAQLVCHEVAIQTPRAGPAMKESSVAAESSDSAVRRCSTGVARRMTCLRIENVGTTKSPASAARATSGA